MSPLRAIAVVPVAAVLFAQLSCSSSTRTATSGGAHFEIVSFPTTDPTLKCDDIGKQADIATSDKKLVVDGADNASVSCQFDGSHFDVNISYNTNSVAATGHITGSQSTDAQVSIGFGGSFYRTPAGQTCTITFVCPGNTDPKAACPTGSSLEGHFICTEVDNTNTAKECAVTGANPAGLPNSYFKFNDCTGF